MNIDYYKGCIPWRKITDKCISYKTVKQCENCHLFNYKCVECEVGYKIFHIPNNPSIWYGGNFCLLNKYCKSLTCDVCKDGFYHEQGTCFPTDCENFDINS